MPFFIAAVVLIVSESQKDSPQVPELQTKKQQSTKIFKLQKNVNVPVSCDSNSLAAARGTQRFFLGAENATRRIHEAKQKCEF